jgi:hypothetical protein
MGRVQAGTGISHMSGSHLSSAHGLVAGFLPSWVGVSTPSRLRLSPAASEQVFTTGVSIKQ